MRALDFNDDNKNGFDSYTFVIPENNWSIADIATALHYSDIYFNLLRKPPYNQKKSLPNTTKNPPHPYLTAKTLYMGCSCLVSDKSYWYRHSFDRLWPIKKL